MKRALNIFLLLTIAIFSLWCTGDLMRKCDQATILAGSYDLAHGRMHESSAYYQLDKTYVVYGVCAALLKFFPPDIDPVAALNISLALIFWLALTVFVVRFRKVLSPLVLLCFLTAPAVLLNTMYVNSSVLSSAFLLLSAALLLNEKKRGSWLAALFFFLAVGSRADIILLLPLILWLITPFPMVGNFFAGLSKHWKICFAGAFALLAGRLICRGGGAAFDPIFNWKMVAGYTVFGFGAAGLLFAVYAVRLAVQAAKSRGALQKLYGLAGLAAFLLPVLFFLPQLHAPRYFWRGCEAVLLLAVSGRLPEWKGRAGKIVFALVALVPMISGVYLPVLNRPRITVATPTLFPSGDGVYPMGGTLPFMLRLRRAGGLPIDHNQLVWAAVHSAQFEFSPEGNLDVLRTPMYGYFMLEASLRGGFARCLPLDGFAGRSFYADSRSLMRDDPKTPLGELPRILAMRSRFVSPVQGGIGILRFGEGDACWGRQTRLLNRLFSGNEYRILASGSQPEYLFRSIVFSPVSFDGSERDAVSGLYYAVGRLPIPDGTGCAESVLPEWMSLQAFGAGQ